LVQRGGNIVVREIDAGDLRKRLVAGDDLQLIDIRSEAEVVHGLLPEARHLPMHLIPLRMSEFPKEMDVVLYCRSGARSYHACAYLYQQGFNNVLHLRGGIMDWARNGFHTTEWSSG
jgi:rhodanese-related sulfurtransferase